MPCLFYQLWLLIPSVDQTVWERFVHFNSISVKPFDKIFIWSLVFDVIQNWSLSMYAIDLSLVPVTEPRHKDALDFVTMHVQNHILL